MIVVSCAYLSTGWGNVAFFIPSWAGRAAVKAPPDQGRPGAWAAPGWGDGLPEAFILRNCGTSYPSPGETRLMCREVRHWRMVGGWGSEGRKMDREEWIKEARRGFGPPNAGEGAIYGSHNKEGRCSWASGPVYRRRTRLVQPRRPHFNTLRRYCVGRAEKVMDIGG